MAVFAGNSTIGPEGLCPFPLLYGSIPRPTPATPCLNQLEQTRAIETAMREVEREQIKRRVNFGLKRYHVPKGGENTNELKDLTAGARVLAYPIVSKRWEGPNIFISSDRGTAVVQRRRGRCVFHSTCVKPCASPMNIKEGPD